MTRAKSRTMRDVLEEKFMPNTWSEDIYQALKEIETLIKASKPEEDIDADRPDYNAYAHGYYTALDDYEANLLKILGGESE